MLSTSPPGSAPLATSAGLPNVHGKNLGPEESVQPVQEAQRGIRFTICGLQPGTGETESFSHQRPTVAVRSHVEVGGAIVGAILANRRKAAMAAEQPAPDGGA